MAKLKDFWRKYELRISILTAFLLSGGTCFALGLLEGRKTPPEPLIIETRECTAPSDQNASKATQESLGANQAKSAPTPVAATGCAFVGSKNSDKFYTPSCSWAKRIKPENMVCYQSEQEALAKGKIKSECQ